jgi:hypothetical protein
VIDISKLQIDGLDKDQIKQAINKWAEEQVDTDEEMKVIKEYVKNG